jgi:hypothetical protein
MRLTTFDFEPCDLCLGTRADQGTYADDCLVNRVTVNKCYVVATVSTPCVATWLAPTSSLNFTPGFVFRLGLTVRPRSEKEVEKGTRCTAHVRRTEKIPDREVARVSPVGRFVISACLVS